MSMFRKGLFFYPFILLMLFTSCVSTSEKQDVIKEKEPENVPEEIDEPTDPLLFYKGPEDLEKALEIMEQMEDEKMNRDSRFVYYSLLISRNDIDKATEQLEILLTDNENDIKALSAYIALMDYRENSSKRDEILEKLISVDPENSFAFNMKGTLALRNKDYQTAEKLYMKSLQSDPQNIDSYIGRANSLMHIEGREEESVLVFDLAEKVDPENPYIYSDRSRVLRFLKDYGRAEDDMTKAIAIYPSEWNYLDRARIRISDLDERDSAKEDLLNIMAINEENFFANVYLAGIYEEEQDYDKALEYYEKIISLSSDYHYAYPALGKLYYIKGQWNKAAEMYARASFSGSREMTYPLMASLSYTLGGDDRKAKSILNDNIGKLDRSSSIYEMYRYYLNPGSPYFVQLAIDKDKNEIMQDRMKFYLAMMDKLNGFDDTAAVILSEIATRKGAYEFILASHELEK